MVTVRIKNTGDFVDVEGSITFVKQVADMGDVTKANSSCSWQLKFPKTPNNFKIFKGLGVAGSTSRTPYEKIVCELLYNGQTIESNGNLIITETKGDEYKGHVKAGIIDFLQDVSNDKISDVIDLSDLSHENTVSNIIASFTAGLPYKYIVAYYNGSPLADESGITNLNPVGLVPSISVKYLWDLIFEYYGWTYSVNFDLTDIYMTYPNAVKYSEDTAPIVLSSNRDSSIRTNLYYFKATLPNVTIIENDYVSQINSSSFTITETGNYNFKANATALSEYSFIGSYNSFYILSITGQPSLGFLMADGNNPFDITLTIQAGSVVSIDIARPIDSNYYKHTDLFSSSLEIRALGVETI